MKNSDDNQKNHVSINISKNPLFKPELRNRTLISNNILITRRNGVRAGKLVLLVFVQEYRNFTILYSTIA